LINGLLLLLTIVGALAAGVALGYYILTAILHLMGHRPQPSPAAQLVTSEAHSGD
jgi:hypothetical protein